MFRLFRKKTKENRSVIFPVGFVFRGNRVLIYSKNRSDTGNYQITLFEAKPGSAKFQNKADKIKIFDGDKLKDTENLCEIFFFSASDLIYLIFTEKRFNQNVCLPKMARKTAVSNDGLNFKVVEGTSNLNIKNPALFMTKTDGEGYMVGGDNTEISITGFSFPNFWHDSLSVIKRRADYFDKDFLMPISLSAVGDLMLLLYLDNLNGKIKLGATFLALYNPIFNYWRTSLPVMEFDFTGEVSQLTFARAIFVKSSIYIYFFFANGNFLIKEIQNPFSVPKKVEYHGSLLERSETNPIIHPDHYKIDNFALVFNPAAIKIDDKIHLIFRAVGADGVSRLGYATTLNGVEILDKLPYPIFTMKSPRKSHYPTYNPVIYPSGGSFGGVEDPRMIKIDDRIYVTFNAFDGWDFIRMAVISISEKDFLARRWNWSAPMLISPPGEIHKNWVIFPEKINGKFAIIHSISPELQIDFVDSLESLALGEEKINSRFGQKKPRDGWDSWLRGAGPPPLKTDFGWLLFYHATDKREPHKYKIGMMLLDLKDPKKILGWSKGPVFSPEMWYENDSKPGVVYACGAVLDGDLVRIYYGGGDKYVCTASISLDKLINYLKLNKHY